MSAEQLRRILIALGVLLVLWVGLRVVRGIGRDDAGALPVPRFDRASVDSVVIERPDDTVRLARRDQSWTVNGFAASPTAVDDLFGAIADSGASSELIAESASSHERLGVDSAQAKRVRLVSGGKPVVEYLVGKRGSNWGSVYVRRPGGNNVFRVRGRLIDMVERRVDDWRDKSIVAIAPDSIAAVEIERGRESYTLSRADTGWSLSAGGPVDTIRVGSLLSQYSRLEASGFATDADTARFEAPDRRVRLVGKGGRTLAVLVFDSTSNGFWVRRDTLPTIYRIDSWMIDQLTPRDSSLIQSSPGGG